MKKSFYQWLLRAVLALVCLLTTTSAWAETWTVAGTPGVLFGSEWSPTTTANDMINVSGNDYILFKNVAYNGSISFKVCKDHAWAEAYPSENYSFDCPAETKGVLFQFNSKTKSVNVIALPSFTVAGNNTTLFGSSTWSASNADNDMTTTDGLTYTWTKENVELSEGDVLFKVCENHAWGTSYPSDNYCLNIPNNGTYNVTITMNSVSHDISATATLIQTTPDVYYVAGATNGTVTGSNDAIFGTAWNANVNQMNTNDDANYTWTSSQVNLNAGTSVEFKVVKNGVTWIPNDNVVCTAEQAGPYILTVTYNATTQQVDGTLTPQFVTSPVFSLVSGNYDTNKDVTITTAGAGTIYYTTDGSDPASSETRQQYTSPIPVHGEGEHVIKAIAIDGSESSEVATAEYTIKYVNIYLFGSVGKAHAWVYSASSNPELVTSDGITYSGVHNVNGSNDYTERGIDYGLFLLTTDFGTTFDSTVPYMIGAKDSNGNFWFNDEHFDQTLPTENGNKNGWSIIKGTYEFFYNRVENTLRVEKFDGPTIYVYDYSRPYIYVEDKNGTPFDGEQPGNPIQTLDETVGGHRDLSTVGNGSGDGKGQLGWYKFAVPVHPANCPVKFQFYHNGDKTITQSDMYETSGDAYYYWDGAEYKPIAKADAAKLRRIVAHVRVQGTTVPICDGVEMNGPSSFYGQMYYWMAVTKFDAGERFVITDGTHNYDNTITSDVYLEWDENSGTNYKLIGESDLNSRLANKTGRGTLIHLLKNKNTPTNNGDYVLGIDTQVTVGNTHTNTTNLGATWWGTSLDSPWKGSVAWTDGILTNYDNSRYLYMENGLTRGPDVYIVTAEDGTEWYTWYTDRSTATIKFGYGKSKEGYPSYLTGGNNAPANPDKIFKFYANYESNEASQTAGEVWYVWTPDFDATLNNVNQSQNNGTLLDVTRTYESRAKQKAMCSTFRDGDYVYYTDIKSWGDENVWCYVWDKNGNDITPWPGVQMIKVGYDDEGHPVYLADLSNYDVTNAAGIIFNNGVKDDHATDKRQTGDLPWENRGCYDYLGLLYRIGGNTDVIDNEPYGENSYLTLRGVWYSRVKGTLFAKGDNDYNNKSENGRGYIDFAKTATNGQSNKPLQAWDYDQSNWVEIYPSLDGKTVTTDDLKALLYKEFTLYGTKQKTVNPTFTAVSISNIGDEKDYEPNHFTPTHFNGSPYQYRKGENEWYFFVEPKPNEFAEINWTIYSKSDDAFYALANTGFTGTINVDWSYHDPDYTGQNMTVDLGENDEVGVESKPELKNLNGYSGWLAIIKFTEETPAGGTTAKSATGTQYETGDVAPSATAGKYTVYPICLNDDYVTAIETINADKAGGMRTLKATRYYNMMGVESSTPFQGVNIIVKEYTDGSRESSKAIMR